MRRFLLTFFFLAMLVAVVPQGVRAQTELEGTLQVIWGDDLTTQIKKEAYLVFSGEDVYQVEFSPEELKRLGGPINLNGAHVSLRLQPTPGGVARAEIMSVRQPVSLAGEEAWPPYKPRPVINAPCAWQGDVLPHGPDYYQTVVADMSPYLGHYFRELTGYSLAGSKTLGWAFFPEPWERYMVRSAQGDLGPDFGKLLNHCVQAHGTGNFTDAYYGINLIFSRDIGCCAWGGEAYASWSGRTRRWGITWMPPWDYFMAGLAHEVFHTWGVPHSLGPRGTGSWADVMSDAWYNCQGYSDPVYGCIPQGTIAHHLDRLSAIAPNERVVINAANRGAREFVVEPLYARRGGVRLVEVYHKLYGASYRFTVEVRDNGWPVYERKLASSGVFIHQVMLNDYRPDPAHLLGLNNDPERVALKPGDRYVFEDVTICVASKEGDDYRVRVGTLGRDCNDLGKITATVSQSKIMVTAENFTDPLPENLFVGLEYRPGSGGETRYVGLLLPKFGGSGSMASYQGSRPCFGAGTYRIFGTIAGVSIDSGLVLLQGSCYQTYLPAVVK